MIFSANGSHSRTGLLPCNCVEAPIETVTVTCMCCALSVLSLYIQKHTACTASAVSAATFQVYDGVMQRLQSVSEAHTALVTQQHACATEDLATHDSDLARLRSQLAEARAEAHVNADKLAAVQETCR